VFGIAVAVVFRSVFYLEMYQNNLFFLKNSFLISTRQDNSKTQKKKKKFEAKKKKIKIS
jgi:hypothetical protein